MSKSLKFVAGVAVLLAIVLGMVSLFSAKKVSLGSEIHFTQDDFKAGIKVDNSEVINSSGEFVGAFNGTTVTASGDVITSGRVDASIDSAASDCSSNAVTLDLSSDTTSVVIADQASAAACALTLSNGSAGELVVLDLIYGGDTAWTMAAGVHYAGDTFDESKCNDFQATAADGDHLIVSGVMIDADTIMPISCQYLDQ